MHQFFFSKTKTIKKSFSLIKKERSPANVPDITLKKQHNKVQLFLLEAFFFFEEFWHFYD
jgi:hypothetical protein